MFYVSSAFAGCAPSRSFMLAVLSTATVSAVGLICKAFLSSGLCIVQVNGLQTLKAAIENLKQNSNRGVITVCNHISTLDDPVIWGVLPVRYYFSSRTTRWALGASDIMFTNPIFSKFFSLGQTLETFRGEGIHQAAVDIAIQKVNQGGWVHLYGEGKVNQPNTYPRDGRGNACLPRFKWGVGRILMEAKSLPVVIPMWLTGFDQLMPEGRPFPYKYLPRTGVHLSITFGDPVSAHEILEALNVPQKNSEVDSTSIDLEYSKRLNRRMVGQANPEQAPIIRHEEDSYNDAWVRQKVTSIIHREVQALGRSISGTQ